LTTPIPINRAHRLILVLSYSYLRPIKPDEERQNNWTKVSGRCGQHAALRNLLARRIVGALDRQGLTVREAESRTGNAEADFSRLRLVRRLSAFGSVLRPDFDPARSDIDLAVEFGSSRRYGPADQYFEFKAAVERLVGRSVDLVGMKAMADSRLKRAIERTQVPV
jgi:uncharacterized protein